MTTAMKKRVWDIPLRLFHWSLVILVATCIYTGNNGGFSEMDYHMLSGYAILTLVVFRVAWGFIGGRRARFWAFIKPAGLIPYLKDLFSRDQKASLGHNPLGGISVLAMLAVLLTQAMTGLFANDDLFLEGPLVHLVEDEFSDQMTSIHHISAEILYVLVGLHLVAILFYEIYKGQRLILPMITGRKLSVEEGGSDISLARELVSALVLISALSGAVYYLVNYV